MLDDIFKRFDGFDANKVMEVVDLVWDRRHQILDLVERLPELLKTTGNSIESAGDSAMKASVFLTGGDDDSPSATELSQLAATALDRCYGELRSVSRLMDSIGQEIDDLNIPSIRPKYKDVMGHRVMSGVDFSESKLVDNAAERIKGGSDRLDEIAKDLKAVASNLRDLGGVLNDTGTDLNNVGLQLRTSGTTLASFADPSQSIAPSTPQRSTTERKTTKRTTTKRTTRPDDSDDGGWSVDVG